MKRHLFGWWIISSSLLAAPLSWAQEVPVAAEAVPAAKLTPLEPEARNRIGMSYRMGLNITADFKKLGGLAALTDPGPATGGTETRNYDDGYNRVDISGNNHGPGFENTTWYWGYQNSGTLQGENIVLNSSSSPANAVSKNREDGPQHGFEITYNRELHRDKAWRLGVETALGYTPLSIADGRTLMNRVDRITDSFSLPSGVVAPPAPYEGKFQGPGAVISSTPTRNTTVVSQAATITGERTLDADVFGLRLGPYLEVPLGKKFALNFSGGLALIVGRTDFSFRETVTIADAGLVTPPRADSGSQTDLLFGGYVGGNLSYALTKKVSVFSGVQFQAAGQAVNQQAGKVSVLDLGESVIVSIGATYAF